MSLPTLPFGGITIAGLSLVISLAVGGFGAYYDLREGNNATRALIEERRREIESHEAADKASQSALWRKMDEAHKETRDDLKEIRNMLMVPPERRAQVFPHENPALHGQK